MIAAVGLLIGAYDFLRRARGRRDIGPAWELQRRYGLYAENRPLIQLDPALESPDLRHLIPLAEKWGIGDDIIRNDFIDQSSSSEKREAAAFMYMEIALEEMGFDLWDEKRAEPPPPSDG